MALPGPCLKAGRPRLARGSEADVQDAAFELPDAALRMAAGQRIIDPVWARGAIYAVARLHDFPRAEPGSRLTIASHPPPGLDHGLRSGISIRAARYHLPFTFDLGNGICMQGIGDGGWGMGNFVLRGRL